MKKGRDKKVIATAKIRMVKTNLANLKSKDHKCCRDVKRNCRDVDNDKSACNEDSWLLCK